MKTQHAHLVALLVMLLVLVAYVAVLNTITIIHPLTWLCPPQWSLSWLHSSGPIT